MEQKELARGNDEQIQHGESRIPQLGVLHVIGGIALIGIAALVIVTLPDIKRYIKISTM